jgi:hypothetical protein
MEPQQLDYRDEIENWAQAWEKAQAAGTFDEPGSTAEVSPNIQTSFFGLSQNNNQSGGIADVDAEYWKQASTMSSMDPSEMIQEMFKVDKAAVKDNAIRLSQSGNPVTSYSAGMDQDPTNPAQKPIDSKELDGLGELKIKLHDIGAKIAEYASKGKDTKTLEAKLNLMRKQLDDLSDELTGTSDVNGGK